MSLGLTYQVRIITLASTVFKKSTHRPSGSGEEYFYMFTLYGHDGHLGLVTKLFCIKFGLLFIRSLHVKFELNWANGL